MADRMAEDSDDDSLKLELVDTPPKRSGPPASSTPHDLKPLPKPDFEESPQNLTTKTEMGEGHMFMKDFFSSTPDLPPEDLTQQMQCSLPTPNFPDSPLNLTTKTQRRESGLSSPGPELPPEICPPKSRVRVHPHLLEARSVSFNDSGNGQLDLVTKPLIINNNNSSFLSENYNVTKLLGSGSYGKT